MMIETDEYLRETKFITDTFQSLFQVLKKRHFKETYNFLNLTYEVYIKDLSQELNNDKVI